MNLAVIIAAGGASSRYAAAGGLRSKIDEDLGGRPVLQRTVELFTNLDAVSGIIVAGPDEGWDEFILRHGDKLGLMGVQVCRGGRSERWETVRNALSRVPDGATHVAVHDAARPCATEDLIERVLGAAENHPAVIPAIDVPDTVKRVGKATENSAIDPLAAILGGDARPNRQFRLVTGEVPRDGLVLVQTPQVFRADLLRRAYAQSDLSSTDDAGLIERLGEPVVVVEGDPRNIKITRPVDLHLARLILQVRGADARPVHKRF